MVVGMEELLVTVVTSVIVVSGVTVIHRVLPFRALKARKPRLAFFPKYVARVTKSLAELELTLERLEFKKTGDCIYERGKVYGDFSAKSIKIRVVLDKANAAVRVSASWMVFFDTGDLWLITTEIIDDQAND